MTNDKCENNPVTATIVDDDNRLSFLPFYFRSRFMVRGENLVYSWLRRLCSEYGGGYWLFYELTNGGFYMAPDLPGPLCIEVDGNGFMGEMSADAAGIVATLFALGQLASEVEGSDAGDSFIDHYHSLLAFVRSHAEVDAIQRAID